MQRFHRFDSGLARYGLACALVLAAVVLRMALTPVLGAQAPLLLFTLPVVVCAFYAGFGPSLLATGLGAFIGAYLFVHGRGFGQLSLADLVIIGMFLSIGTAVSVLGKRLMDAFHASVDVTQKLEAANRRKDEFLAMLAHELRNPLTAINTAASLLQIAQADPTRTRNAAQVITRQVRHTTRLVDDLLDVSRVTRGLITLHRTPVDLAHVAQAAVEQIRPLIDAHRHRITLELPPERACVSGDEVRLVQATGNFLSNAAKYTPPGGDIRVRVQVLDGWVELSVHDNGTGIAPDLLPHVFDLFMQAERTIDRSQGGLGIGLALVRSLIELHGGSVHVASAGVGKGSTFALRLPHLHGARKDAPQAPAPTGPAVAARPLRVLVVDDNVDAAQTLTMFVESLGHAAATEFHSGSAVEHARSERFDVMLLDIGLPEMDGYTLCRELRRMPHHAGALVIAITGYGSELDRAQSAQAGFDHHLVKPVDLPTLADLLARHTVQR